MPDTTPKSFSFKALKIIHLALVAGPVTFVIVSWLLVARGAMGKEAQAQELIFIILSLVLAGITLAAGRIVFAKRLEAIRQMEADSKSKLYAYLSASIPYWAMTEAPAMFSLVGFLLTGSRILLGIGLCLIVYLIFQKPTVQKMANDLGISESEIEG